MCRLYGFRATEETKVECSLAFAQNALLMQSREDMIGRAHPDGWGIAFYHDQHPELERRATAAFDDLHFSSTAERIFTTTVVAHVRLATVGDPEIQNCHPFAWQQWAFAHNGTVRGFDLLRSGMIEETLPELRAFRKGSTDSEHSFYWLLSRMKRAGIDLDANDIDPHQVAEVLEVSVCELNARCRAASPEEIPRLNFLITDGQMMVACRWDNSLYFLMREGVHDCEICGIPHVHHQDQVAYRAAIVASEPISHEAWQEVPEHHIVVIDSDAVLHLTPMGADVQSAVKVAPAS